MKRTLIDKWTNFLKRVNVDMKKDAMIMESKFSHILNGKMNDI
jgi:hypothetical protein